MNITTPPVPPASLSPARPAPAPQQPLAGRSLRHMAAALLWKEGRELFLWALVAMAALGAMIGYTFTIEHRGGNPELQAVTRNFRAIFVGFPPILAALLGFAQFLFDARPARYQFITHRPAPRTLIFACKLAAGLGFYAAATLLPLLAALAWASTPTHIALPFTWTVTWSLLADLAAAIPFYFAGALAAMRWGGGPRRWIALLLVLGAVFAASYLNQLMPGVLPAYITSAFMTLLLLVPAWAQDRAGAESAPRGRMPRAMLALALALGCSVAGTTLVEGLKHYFPRSPSVYTFSQPAFLDDGTPLLLTGVYHERGIISREVRTLAGKPLFQLTTNSFDPRDERLLTMHYLMHPQNREFSPNPHIPEHYFVRAFTLDQFQAFLPARGDYLQLYDLHNEALVGAIGIDGLEPARREARKPFPGPINVTGPISGTILISAGDTLYRLTNTFEIARIYQDPSHEPITGHEMTPAASLGEQRGTHPVIQTASSLTLLKSINDPAVLVRMPLTLQGGYAELGYLSKEGDVDSFLAYTTGSDARGNPAGLARVLRTDGVLRAPIEVPPATAKSIPTPDFWHDKLFPAAFMPALRAMEFALAWLREPAQLAPLAAWFAPTPPMIVGPLLAALAALLLAYFRWRSLPVALGWAAVSLLLGVFALPAIWCVDPPARRLPCAACGKPRPITASTCPHCHEPVTGPAPTGTEIFAPTPS